MNLRGYALASAITLGLLAGSMPNTFAAQAIEQPGEQVKKVFPNGEIDVKGQDLPVPQEDPTNAKFEVKKVALDATELHLKQEDLTEIVKAAVGEEKTLADLNRVAMQLTIYARTHGYPAAAAYLPTQESSDGALEIKMIPGRYGDVKIENETKLKEDAVKSFLNGWRKGEIIRTKSLETALYSISEISGTKAIGTLSPGKEFGTSDITVRILAGKEQSSVAYVENYGNKNSGRYRLGLQHTIYDMGGTGAKFNVGTMHSNEDTHNYYVNYETLVGRGGTTLGIGYSHMNYHLGGSVSNLGLEGKADTLSLFGSRPIFHMTDSELKFLYGYDYRRIEDEMNAFQGLNNKKHSHSAHVGLQGMQRNPQISMEYGAMLTAGRLGYDRVGAQNTTHRAEGGYLKFEANASVVQKLGARSDVLWKFSAQKAGSNLDSSEEFYLGGPRGVRAYPQGEGSGDSGWLGTIEARYYTDVPGLLLSTYLDGGHVTISHDGYNSSGYNGMTLKGWGLGVSYTRPSDWFARLDYARRIGVHENASKEARDSKGRAWFMLGKIW